MQAHGSGGRRHAIETAAVVLSWFLCNITLSSSTKWLFLYGEICTDGECHKYNFPLAITVIHMVFSRIMCQVYLKVFRRSQKRITLSIEQQTRKVAPLAACFVASVAMGNLSLKFIYPSFNQMLGAITPLVTVLMAVVLTGKRYNWWTWATMPIICGGLVMCSVGEVHFHLLGALYAFGAMVLRAGKSIMQAKLLDPGESFDAVTLLYYMAPYAAALVCVGSLCTEGLAPYSLLLYRPGVTGVPRTLLMLAMSGMNACLLNVSNFLVTSYTSPVTLQVLGNVKNCLSIAVSVAIFRNPLLPSQLLGVVICLFGVFLYNKKGGSVQKVQRVPHRQADPEETELGIAESSDGYSPSAASRSPPGRACRT